MLSDQDRAKIEKEIKWEKAEKYKRHGCSIHGTLLVANCEKAFRAHPKWGRFGAQCMYDIMDIAKDVLNRSGIDFVVKLAIPDLVSEVCEEDRESFMETVSLS